MYHNQKTCPNICIDILKTSTSISEYQLLQSNIYAAAHAIEAVEVLSTILWLNCALSDFMNTHIPQDELPKSN